MKDLININRLNRFGQNIWTRIKNTFMTKEDAINGVLVGQEWTKIGSVTCNNSIILPSTDTFTELYIEMYSSNGTITHNINIRLDSILFESNNNEYREILLDSVYDAQTYVKYDFATNSIIPCMYEGNMIDSSSTEIITNIYTKTNNIEVGNIEAEKIVYDNSFSDISTNNVQGAIDEVSKTLGYTKSYNLLPCNKVGGAWNGITTTPVLDNNGLLQYYSLSGTRDAETYYNIYDGPLPKGIEAGKTYKVNTNTTDGRFYMTIYQTVNSVDETAVTTVDGNENVLWTVKPNTTRILVRINIVVTAGTFTDTRFYPMIRPSEIEDSTYIPYVPDIETKINTLTNVIRIYETLIITSTTTFNENYRFTADRNCIVSLSSTAYYNNSVPKQIKIQQYSYEDYSAMTSILNSSVSPQAINASTTTLLKRGESLKVLSSYFEADETNTVKVAGYVQYLE